MNKPLNKQALTIVTTTLFLAGGCAAAIAKQDVATSQVGKAEASAIALKARPGVVTDAELEHERGGSGLRWSFDITSNGKTYEVGVDAADGAILENRIEGRNPD